MEGCSEGEAAGAVTAIHEAVAVYNLEHNPKISFAIGYDRLEDNDTDITRLISRCDARMYADKKQAKELV